MLNQREVKAGDKFGYRTALGEQIRKRVGKRGKLKIYELCRCTCGKEKYVCRDNLFSGKSTNCACIQYKNNATALVARSKIHGMTNTRLFRIYSGMCTRCNNPNEYYYKNYGGRGIRCLRHRFSDFYNDMHKSYEEHINKFGEDNTTLDRINVNGDYCKENCRWATLKEQGNNTRFNRKITYKGETLNVTQMAEKYGMRPGTLFERLRRGYTVEMAIEKPLVYTNKGSDTHGLGKTI